MTINTISQRAFLNAILTGELVQVDGEGNEIRTPLFDGEGNLNEKVAAFATSAIDKLDARNEARKTSKAALAKQAEQEELMETIFTLMNEGTAYMASEIAAALTTETAEVKTAKASAMLRKLADVDRVVVGETKCNGRKVKTYTKVVADSE